ANSKHITTYFRKSIVVANPSAFSRLLLRLIRDDGAVVYFNGVEVYRNNMLAGPISYNSLAATTIDGPTETAILDVSLSPTSLLAGTNSIAVEIHQAAPTSSDIGFDLALLGLTDTNLTQGVYIVNPANQARIKTPANVALSASAASDSAVSKVEYFADGSKIGEAAANPYSFTWSNAPVGMHSLIAIATDAA